MATFGFDTVVRNLDVAAGLGAETDPRSQDMNIRRNGNVVGCDKGHIGCRTADRIGADICGARGRVAGTMQRRVIANPRAGGDDIDIGWVQQPVADFAQQSGRIDSNPLIDEECSRGACFDHAAVAAIGAAFGLQRSGRRSDLLRP
jgi:hypothetical protein